MTADFGHPTSGFWLLAKYNSRRRAIANYRGSDVTYVASTFGPFNPSPLFSDNREDPWEASSNSYYEIFAQTQTDKMLPNTR